MAATLSALHNAITKDTGLKAGVSTQHMSQGLAAADRLSAMILRVLKDSHLNDDGLITAADMATLSHAVRYNAVDYWNFVDDHGDDENGVETGFHLLQNDGGSLKFQGRNFIDSVVDGIYHFGSRINANARFENEDGNENELVVDVAGWLNYFVNGKNVVFGDSRSEELYSGVYSAALAAAANETFLAGAGNDVVWAGVGNDSVLGGLGNDKAGGEEGNDTLKGEEGNDTLYGEEGRDYIYGGSGADILAGGTWGDKLSGGTGSDTLYGEVGRDTILGEDGNDKIYAGTENDSVQGGNGNDLLAGEAGNDTLLGEAGMDEISGGEGHDAIQGGLGNDQISAGEGRDVIRAGEGADTVTLWENVQATDRLIFKAGDSGKTRATIDHIEGFKSGVDLIDLRSYTGMSLADLDYRGGGRASCYFDGRHLRIDGNGDAVTDMIIEFKYVADLVARDFLFA